MKLFKILIFLQFLSFTLQAQPPAGKGYTLLFDESFSTPTLNESNWRYRIDRRTGYGYMDGLNRKENVYIKDSALHIILNHQLIDGKWENTGGGIISNHNFGYGYYECLSKPFMLGHGVHTSFWQRGSKDPNNNIFEIDSYEIDSKTWVATNNLYFDLPLYGTQSRPWPHRAQVPFRFDKDGWFLDAYELTPEGVLFYDNGQVVAKAEINQLNARQNVWLTALNGVGKVDTLVQPGESIFKYFRYYAKDYPGISILPNGNFEYNQSKYDSLKPLCWINEGTTEAIHVVEGDAFLENYKLRMGTKVPYKSSIHQQLDYIMNGEYQLSAMVKSSAGDQQAFIKVSDFGGKDIKFKIPKSSGWTKIKLPPIKVANHQVTITIGSEGNAGEWTDLDDIVFLKPIANGKDLIRAKPFANKQLPIWQLAEEEPIRFIGDQKFYFFDRNVGFGDSISIQMDIKTDEFANTIPIARIPKTGESGWAIQLKEDGHIIFRIGSLDSHTDVVTDHIYQPGKIIRLACTFENGVASIYINNQMVKQQTGIKQNTKESKTAGRLGTVGRDFEAVGDVVMQLGDTDKENKTYKNFRGSIQHLRIYNRKIKI